MTAAVQEPEPEPAPEESNTTTRHRQRLLRTPKADLAESLLQYQQEERQARRYPWPPRSPAARLQRLVQSAAPSEELPPSVLADIQAVLQTYGLLVQIAKRGEHNQS